MPHGVAERAWRKGEALYHQGDDRKYLYSLRGGLVILERVDGAGTLTALRLLRPGALFPCADLVGDGSHGNTARALTDVAACLLPADALKAAMRTHAAVGDAVLTTLCGEGRTYEDMAFRLRAMDMGERLLALIEELAAEEGTALPDGGRRVRMPVSWREVAALIGSSPEVVSRLLRKLGGEGRIRVDGREVTLVRREPARQAAG
ncbi:Crp/Fnr family transcriptional regulator [Magnetospirillum sp. UT-4]|uniref:Crp/Fnr family transcriptional regulator n=1 Tax=Magnetospirillum sp. UT-4 TaxID=2681467 RepID=UPI00137EC14E